MNKNKLFAVVISLALMIAMVLPGTLAVSADEASSEGTVAVPSESTLPEPGAEQTPIPEEPEQPEEPEKPVVPEIPEEVPVCTCDPQPAEGEPHQEDCPLYTAPEATGEETEGESEENEEEPVQPLYERLMAALTAEEFMQIVDSTPAEEFSALTDEEFDAVEAYYIFLTTGAYPDYSPVVDEVMEIVDYTYVAPFGEPVIGGRG